MGELHLKKYNALANVELVGVYDKDTTRSETAATNHNTKSFQNLSELLFEVDAVSIASHTDSHYENCKRALEAGTHVLVEKPMCGNPKEARELVQLAEKNSLILQVGYLERYRFNRLLAHLTSTNIRFVDVHWNATELPREKSIDVISDLLVHPLDMVLSLIPSDVSGFSVTGSKMVTDLLDIVSVRLEFRNGAQANLWISRVASHRERKLYLFSDTEQATINFITNHVELMRPAFGTLEKVSFSLENGGSKPDVLLEQCADFIESVKTGRAPTVSGKQGLRVLETADAIRKRSLETQYIPEPSFREVEHGI